jgi:hypothetical protein
MLPNYHPFCVIAVELFFHVHVECVLRYSIWLIFMSSVLTLNFSSNLGKHLPKLMKWLKTFMVINAWAVHIVMNDLSDLRMVGSQYMMNHIWDGPQRHVTMLMLRKFVKSCILTVVWQCSAENSRGVQHVNRLIRTTKLEMHRVVSEFVPWLLTQDQRDIHVAICQELLDLLVRMKTFWKEL